jgi:hypothetical protein
MTAKPPPGKQGAMALLAVGLVFVIGVLVGFVLGRAF